MDRLSRALCLGQNSSSNTDSDKNKESAISEKIEKSLKDWKLPACSASDIYKRSGIFSTVRTVEKEIPLSESYATFPLFSNNLIKRVYQKIYKFLHVGMIQVALKPTKLGSNTSAVICLRDERFLKYDQSVLRMVKSSLRDGPIYLFYCPTYCVSLSDTHCAFTIDIKTKGSNTMRGDESIILMYRFHYKVTDSWSPHTKNLSLILTKVAQSNRVLVSKTISRNNSSSSNEEEVAVANARVDWKETVEAHVLKVDVPGLKKEEVKVEVEDGSILQISGERSKEQEENDDIWHCVERRSGKFLRRVTLPENAKSDEVKAAMENGVLTVTVPKEHVKKKPEVKVIDISG